MKKKLSEMTLEELWTLFPIILTAHDPRWKTWYREEAEHILKCMGEIPVCRMEHIGSTAVETIWAKPIVDILLEVSDTSVLAAAAERIISAGYICMSREDIRMSFNKGYTEDGFAEKVFHLHLRCQGDHDEIYFRDWLLAHPGDAEAYEALKLSLWKTFEHDRDGYTAAKGALVAEITRKAKEQSKKRPET